MHQRKDGTWAMQMVCNEDLKEQIDEYMQDHDIDSDSAFLKEAARKEIQREEI